MQQPGNWPQLDRIRKLCHKEVSHKWLSHLDAKIGFVFTAIDYVINIQKRLGARTYTGGAPVRFCGAHLESQLEHAELCSTAEATRRQYACVRAVVDGLARRSRRHH